MSATGQLQGGQLFGRYRIVRVIGEGGMGVVYEAIHPGLKKRFAIKTLLPAAARHEEARLRFLREGEAASHINHPNVVTVSDVGVEAGIPFLVMELLEGQTLAQFLANQRTLGAQVAVGLLLPVISAVAAGHDSGVIHRDLKPDNIFLARGRRGEIIPKVLDFGVSKFMGDHESAAITRTMTVLGTAAYMSPEQARGAKRVDFQSDQYALGLILYEMVTGSRAYPGENALEILHKVATGTVPAARELNPSLSPDMDAVLARMLAPSATDRFASLHACGRALLPLADESTRLALANEFNAPAPGDGAGTLAAGTATATATLPSTSGPVSPFASASVMDTTLRHAAGESARMSTVEAPGHDRGGRPRARRATVIGATLVGVLAVAALGRWGVGSGWRDRSHSRNSPPGGERTEPEAPLQRVEAAAAAATSGAPRAADPEPPRAIPFEIRSEPANAQIAIDDRPPMRGLLELVLPLAGTSHEIRVSAPGYVSKVVSFAGNGRPPSRIRLEQVPPLASRPPAAQQAVRPAKKTDPAGKANDKTDKVMPTRQVTPAVRSKKPDCDPNFYLDAQGEKHFRPECFLNKTP